MTHPLEDRVAHFSRRVRRLRWTWAICKMLVCAIAAVLLAGLADYFFRMNDTGLRVLASLAVVGIVAWACARYLLPAWRRRSTQLEMARQIEQRYPGLDDRLASSLDFLRREGDHSTSGSSELRESVIRQTTEQLARVDFGELISAYAVRRAAALAMVLLAIGLGLLAWDASSARLALARLAQPWQDLRWPQRHHLEFRDAPRHLATGADFEVELVDQGGAELPDDVRIHFRNLAEDGQKAKEVVAEPIALASGAIFARRENVTQSFEYRATGGDDNSMPWTRLDVIDAPRIASIEVMLYPPAYTGWPPYQGERRIRAYQGTRVAMSGRLTKPVSAVRLHRPEAPPLVAELNESGDEFSFAADGAAPLIVEKSSPYWLEFDDLAHDGMVGGRDDRWDIIALADEKPSVLLEQPSRDVAVVADAVVPLHVLVKDDIRTHSVDILYRHAQDAAGETQHIRLMEAPRASQPQAASATTSGDQHAVSYEWKLAELKLEPGTELLVRAAARDFKPQQAESSVRRLRIVKPTDLLEQLASRQAAILTDLARARQLQITAREKAATTRIQLEEVRRWDAATADRAHAAMLSQQQVDRAFDDPTDGVIARIDAALADIRSNHLDRDNIAEDLGQIAKAVRRVHDDVLPAVRGHLTTARKLTQDADPSGSHDEIVEQLSKADVAQQEVIAVLDAILGKHAEWSGFHQLYRDISQIKAAQENIIKQTAKLGEATVGRQLEQLAPEQLADLKKLAFSQTELSRQVENARVQLRAAADNASADDTSDVRNALADAIRLAEEAGVAAKMQGASEALSANRIGVAATAQQSAVNSLEELLDVLANRRERRLGKLVEQLRAAERELHELKQKQEQLCERLSKARGQSDAEQQRELKRLVAEQRELLKKVEQFARQLRRLQAVRASQSAARASKRMSSAAAAAESGNAGGAESMAQAAEADLEQATQELAQSRQAAEMDLAYEQMIALEFTLKQIIERQQTVLEETEAIDESGAARRIEDMRGRELVALARRQQLLREETASAAKSLTSLEIVRATLDRAANQMDTAAKLLGERQAGAAAQKAEREALRQLSYVMRALSSDPKKNGGQGVSNGGGDGGGETNGPLVNIAELRLAIIVQEQLEARTAELEAQREAGMELNPTQRAEYNDLQRQQAELADWIFKLSEPVESNPEDQPGDFLPADEPEGRDTESIDELLPSLFEDE